MLGLQVAAPEYLVLKLIVVLHENVHSLGVGHMAELGIHHRVQALQQALVHKLVKELHFLRRMLHHIADHVFQHGLCHDHVVLQIRESQLGLDHPELCRMTGGVGILCAEGRSKCIHVAECAGKRLHVQLAADGQIRLFSEEILAVVHFAVLGLRHVVQIQCRHLEHLARTLAVTACNQGCMHVNKISLLEKFMDRIRDDGTHAENSLECVRSRAEMTDGSQVLKAVALLLQGVIRRGHALDLHGVSLNLKRLLRLGGCHQRACNDDRTSHIQLGNLRKIVHGVMIYDLQRLKKASVRQDDKSKCFGITDASDPSAHLNLLSDIFFFVSVNLSYGNQFHFRSPY